MRTTVIEGMQPSRFDKELLLDLELIGPPPDVSANEAFLIGIRDEHGDIYRTINVEGSDNVAYLIGKLNELGYLDQPPNSYEAELGYDTIINVVKIPAVKR
jgi:hypothetical protein